MSSKKFWLMHGAVAAAMFSAAIGLAPQSAFAQTGPVAGVGSTSAQSVTATVKAINLATRHVTLVGPNGETSNFQVGKAVKNLDQVKVGDKIKATYYVSTLYVLAKQGTKLPDDAVAAVEARAAKGQTPAAGAATRITVTDTVLGVDMAKHTLKLADPQGGQVRTVVVTDKERQKQLAMVKVGDTITAYVTEALVISVDKP
jgi:hypothetical protein